MQYALRRLIERGIVARRGDAAWIRKALTDAGKNAGRNDLYGTVASIDGDTIVDPEQNWPTNLWGRATIDGKRVAGANLRIVEGPGAGTECEILLTQGDTLQAAIDLEDAGVDVDSVYEIDPPQVTEAATYFANVAIHVVMEFPADHALLPYYAVIQTNEAEGSAPIGRLRGVIEPPGDEGPIQHEIVSMWDEAFTIVCAGKTPDEAVWLGKMLTHLYRSTLRYFDGVFQGNLRLRGSGLRPVMDLAPFPTFVAEFTLSGQREKFAVEDVEWMIDSEAPEVDPTPAPVSLRVTR